MDTDFYDLVNTYKNDVAHDTVKTHKEKYNILLNLQNRLKKIYRFFIEHEILRQLLQEHVEYYHSLKKSNKHKSQNRYHHRIKPSRLSEPKQSVQFGVPFLFDRTNEHTDDTSILDNNNSYIDDDTEYRIHIDPNDFFVNGKLYSDYHSIYTTYMYMAFLFQLYMYNKHQHYFKRYDNLQTVYESQKIEIFRPTARNIFMVMIETATHIYFEDIEFERSVIEYICKSRKNVMTCFTVTTETQLFISWTITNTRT